MNQTYLFQHSLMPSLRPGAYLKVEHLKVASLGWCLNIRKLRWLKVLKFGTKIQIRIFQPSLIPNLRPGAYPRGEHLKGTSVGRLRTYLPTLD
jgi:hypothetical protein